MNPKTTLAGVSLMLRLLAILLITPSGEALAGETSSPAITSDSVNLSGRDYFRAYTSRNRLESEKARLYMLGVSDASERQEWCDYKQLSMAALREFVYEYFKKLPEHQLDARASTLIQEALKTNFPCKGNR